MPRRQIPYTANDLRSIADQIDDILNKIDGAHDDLPDHDWRWNLTIDIKDEFGDSTGTIRAHGDGWLAYYPHNIEEN